MAQTLRSSKRLRSSGAGVQTAGSQRDKSAPDDGEVTLPEAPPAPAHTHRASRDHKTCWAHRFERPTAEQLILELNSTARKQIEHARANFGKTATESIEWLGTWHWTFVYRSPRVNGIAYAYLVPDPARPRMCVPTDDESLLESPARIHKLLKDALLRSPVVDSVRWVGWDIQSKDQVDAIVAFARDFAHAGTR